MGASCFGPGEASYFVPQAAARDKEYLLSQPDIPQAACRASAKATASWMAHAFRLFYFLFFLFFPFFFYHFFLFFFYSPGGPDAYPRTATIFAVDLSETRALQKM